ncbi:hypothetical protein CBR_g21018 [Chara braunii]|uniref:histidine kinase n=1 Tax=Chara braunii TaxID=69332 RepID=A0A388L0C6_CHABU|nr:hypothetical protein CBR_g21018 [Chara braunii]|eukprot:GBG75774.1 hypothetical protein CBR_g21018 [Chara braunii]
MLRKEKVDIRETVEHVLQVVRPFLDWKVMLYNCIPGDLPGVEGDKNRITQILHNIIDNAARFSTSGLICVTGMTVTDNNGLDCVAINVSDSANCISSENFASMFKESKGTEPTSTCTTSSTGQPTRVRSGVKR